MCREFARHSPVDPFQQHRQLGRCETPLPCAGNSQTNRPRSKRFQLYLEASAWNAKLVAHSFRVICVIACDRWKPINFDGSIFKRFSKRAERPIEQAADQQAQHSRFEFV